MFGFYFCDFLLLVKLFRIFFALLPSLIIRAAWFFVVKLTFNLPRIPTLCKEISAIFYSTSLFNTTYCYTISYIIFFPVLHLFNASFFRFLIDLPKFPKCFLCSILAIVAFVLYIILSIKSSKNM